MLDATHLGKEKIEAKLPDIADFCRTYMDIDPAEKPIPVQPTAHYGMGGIPTDSHGRVETADTLYPGLYAAGECACVSVHGANRLGTNSLVDLIVFGRRAGRHIAEFVKEADLPSLPDGHDEDVRSSLETMKSGGSGPTVAEVYEQMQTVMMSDVGIYRNADGMKHAAAVIGGLREKHGDLRLQDTNSRFNTELLEVLELQNLLDLALVTTESALNREESRGAHSREDFPDRDDEKWLKHTLAGLDGGTVSISYKEVDSTRFEPKPRVY